MSFICCCRASMISASTNSNRRGRLSIRVTGMPNVARIEAYSVPITPPPTMTIESGMRLSVRSPSVSMMVSSSNGMSAGLAGTVPTAMTMKSAVCSIDRAGLLNAKPMGIDEAGRAEDHVDVVAGHLILHDLDFVLDDVIGAEGEVFDRDRLFQTIAGSVQIALAESGEVEHRFAEGFAGDGAGIDADAADDCFALDDADVLAELGGLDGGLLAGGPRADDEKIVMSHQVSAYKG